MRRPLFGLGVLTFILALALSAPVLAGPGGKFKPGSRSEKFDIKVKYNPAPNNGGSTTTIARFQNKMTEVSATAQ